MDRQPLTRKYYGSAAPFSQSCLRGVKALFVVLCDSLIQLIAKYIQIESEGRNSTIVLDYLMHEMFAMSDIGKLLTKGRSHLNCNVTLLWQYVFPKGPKMRNLSINAQHIVIF